MTKRRNNGAHMRNDSSKVRAATLAALISNFIFGLSFMASRIALEHTTSAMMLTLRFGSSVIIMLALAILGITKLNLRGKPLHRLLMLGLFHPIIYFIGETNGIKYTNSSFAGIMISLIPVATALFSGIFLHEKMSAKAYAWIFCSVAGVIVISLSQAGGGAVHPVGILYLCLAIFAGAMFYVFSRSISGVFTPFERTFISMLMGFIFYASVGLVQEGSGFVQVFTEAATDRYVLLPVLFLSVISSVIAFMLQNYSVTYLDAAKVTVFSNMVPIVSLLAGVLLLGEPFSAVYLIGIALILVGVYKANTVK